METFMNLMKSVTGNNEKIEAMKFLDNKGNNYIGADCFHPMAVNIEELNKKVQ